MQCCGYFCVPFLLLSELDIEVGINAVTAKNDVKGTRENCRETARWRDRKDYQTVRDRCERKSRVQCSPPPPNVSRLLRPSAANCLLSRGTRLDWNGTSRLPRPASSEFRKVRYPTNG